MSRNGRDGGDPEALARRLSYPYEVRDRVVDGAAIEAGFRDAEREG
jgi:hypothetical protein